MSLIRSLTHHFLTKKITIAKWQLSIYSLTLFTLGSIFGLYYLANSVLLPKIRASSSPWTQTDWSTESDYSEITDIDNSTEGELKISAKDGWFDDNWTYRKTIQFNNTEEKLGIAPEELTDFPVLIELEGGVNIDYSKLRSNAEDIRFVDSEGTLLSYEIELWDNTGNSFVWVKVPTIETGDEAYIHMYYGNDSASDAQDPSSVWDDGFLGVWHLNQSVNHLGALNSSTGSNHGTWEDSDSSGSTGQSGIIGKSLNFNLNDKVSTNIIDQLGDFTAEVWFKDDGVRTIHERLADKSYTACFWLGRNASTADSWGGGVKQVASPYGIYVTLTDGEWNQIASVRSASTHYMYGNGSSQMTSMTVSTDLCDATSFAIGAWGAAAYTQQRFGGHIDEVRLSSIARSRAWISASYSSGKNTFNTYESEETKYASTGVLTSTIFDSGHPSDWGILEYSHSGSGTITLRVRSDSQPDMSSADNFTDSCNLTFNCTEGTCTSTDTISTLSDCVNDQERYLQYQVILIPEAGSTPVFENISIAFSASDQIPPSTNASDPNLVDISDGAWTNTKPTINWVSGQDNEGGSGIFGYCLSLDEANPDSSNNLDPLTSGGVLHNLDDGVSNNACPYIVNSESINLSNIVGLNLISGKQYYFSIKAIDNSDNVWTGNSQDFQDLISFKYDGQNPANVSYISTPSVNFGSVNDMHFSWPPTGSSASSDSHSGILGWQYSLDGGSTWKGPTTHLQLGINYIENDGNTYSHNLTEGDDGADISIGTNTVFFRTIDNVGNTSNYVTGGISYGGAAPAFGSEDSITISPETSSSNSFTLSWPEAIPTGENSISSYYYMINTTPPSTLNTLTSNSTRYIPTNNNSVEEGILIGSTKGGNTVYVVAVDSEDNYSPSNYISGIYTLNSSLPDPAKNLTVSDSSIKSEEIWRASLSWSEPDYTGTGELTYTIERSTDNETWHKVSETTGTSYTDITPYSQTYYYRIGSYDTTDDSKDLPSYTASVSIIPQGSYVSAANLTSGPSVSSVTTKNANITWSTSRSSDSKVQYGTTSNDYFEEEPSKANQVMSHDINLSNLSSGTKYYYRAKWTDEDGNTGISEEKTFTTDPAPLVKEVEVNSIGIDSAIVNFTVEHASEAHIYYGESTSYGGLNKVSTSISESRYSVQLIGLTDGTKYYLKVNTFDTEDQEYEGEVHSFETLPRPQISNVRLQEVTGTAQPALLVTWESNTEISSIITYYPQGQPAQAQDSVNVNLLKGEHKMLLKGLLPETNYVLTVKGRDKVGNEASSSLQNFTTATDTRPPLMNNLKVNGSIKGAGEEAQAQLVVTWNTDEPATSQVEFGEGSGSSYSQRTQQDSNLTFNHLVVIPNLSPQKVYHLRAISQDSVGNETHSVDTVTITPKATDNALDLVIRNLTEAFGFLKR